MTPHQFWHDDPDDLWAYCEAYEQKQKEMVKYDNIKSYNLGQYFLLAISQCLQFSKTPKQIYPKKPFDILKEEKKELTPDEISSIRKANFMRMEKLLKIRKENGYAK